VRNPVFSKNWVSKILFRTYISGQIYLIIIGLYFLKEKFFMTYNIRKFMQVAILAMGLVTICNLSAYEAEINKLSATMAEKIAAAKKAKVAVVDFTDLQGDVTELGRFIAEEFSAALAGAGKGFKVVDRTHLKSIIKEHKLSEKGIIDPKTARKLGKIAGVEALVTGTLTPFGDTVRISVKILDTDTAEVIEAKRGNIAKTEAINDLLATSVTSVPPSARSPKGKSGKPLQTVEAGGFIFKLMSCKLSSKTIKCSFVITSPGEDRILSISGDGDSKLFDYEGNEYGAGSSQIANSQKDNGWLDKRLVSGIPTKSSISFVGIPPKIKGIALLELRCDKSPSNRFNGDNYRVQFRNVPLSR
jgi:TolB-like protein